MKWKSILAFVGMMIMMPANAQQIIIETTDTAITSNHLFATPEGEYTTLTFNAKGVATYNCNSINEKASTTLMLQDGNMFVMVCEPGKTQRKTRCCLLKCSIVFFYNYQKLVNIDAL